ncbi:GSCOCG00011778001-RA-CDS, partial [Cotesia congregata]
KELGLPGSGVFIPEAQFNVAERAQSATAMATSLLMSVFPRSVIANSNLRGGKPKTKNSTVQHSALDSDKLTAIHDAVEKRFKRRYNKSEVNRAINVKCSRVRSEKKEAK